ncbi:MAG: SUMF1/EgtB/PvdO family nonheme iron enzyme [Cyanobacteriota bacterium]
MDPDLEMEAKGSAQGGDSAHRFYISSPFLGLKKEREEAKKLITRRNHAYGDSYGGSPDPLVETCQRDVRASDHYVLILGERYGTRRPEHGNKSVTELEFEAALEAGLSLHAYFLGYCLDTRNGIERDPEVLAALKAFQRRVSDHCVPVDCSDQEDGRNGWQVFTESITALAAKPHTKRGQEASGSTNLHRTYTSYEIENWVNDHSSRLSQAFNGTSSVRLRAIHVPLAVEIELGGSAISRLSILQDSDLVPLLEDTLSRVLLITGEGGTGKTSLAFTIGRWLLMGKPGGLIRLPIPIETALAEGQTLLSAVKSWLRDHLGYEEEDNLVAELLRRKRILPILDHVSELTPWARKRIYDSMPPGLFIVTSRSSSYGWPGKVVSTIRLQPIAADRLQSFFVEYLKSRYAKQQLLDDELVPAQDQLRRIVGEKPITALLAQIFIDDVISNRERGLLAGSIPTLMLNFLKRLDTPDEQDESLRQRGGMNIDHNKVQETLKVLALASQCQRNQRGRPFYQPLEFSCAFAMTSLKEPQPIGLGLTHEGAQTMLSYLLDINLLIHPDADLSELRFPLDPLADYLAALKFVEITEVTARDQSLTSSWESLLVSLEDRKREGDDLDQARGFFLALRDVILERRRGLIDGVADRLAILGNLDPHLERQRLAEKRVRKWAWELVIPDEKERCEAIQKLIRMSASSSVERLAVKRIARGRLVEMMRNEDFSLEERKQASHLLGLLGTEDTITALQEMSLNASHEVDLRRSSLESLGLACLSLIEEKESHKVLGIERFLSDYLGKEHLDKLVRDEEDWLEIDQVLPLIQGASRGLQVTGRALLRNGGNGHMVKVPMLTLRALCEGESLRIKTDVVYIDVWNLSLPGGIPLEMVLIKAGEALLGSSSDEEGRNSYLHLPSASGIDVEAQRPIRTSSFYMSRYPITQEQWRSMISTEDEECARLRLNPGERQGEQLPVTNVSWFDAMEWCSRLNSYLNACIASEVRLVSLPSESQWEYACRAGTSTPFFFGDTIDTLWAAYNGEFAFGCGRKKPPIRVAWESGSSGLVNSWGLSDMHGNLWEWCLDWWHPSPTNAPMDGGAFNIKAQNVGSIYSHQKVIRGGSFFYGPIELRSAKRSACSPDNKGRTVGFRICCPDLAQGL